MPVDWDKFDSEIDSIIDDAEKRTDEKLVSKISSVTRMTDEEVTELFPKAADAKNLAELLKIVNDATDRNTKINNIIANSEKFAGIILTLVGKFV